MLFGKGEHKFALVDKEDSYIVLNKQTKDKVENELSSTIIDLPGHTYDSIGLLLSDSSLIRKNKIV
ncbi:MAG: hypothetical protein ABF289_09750 [Clostridiales bacterium]